MTLKYTELLAWPWTDTTSSIFRGNGPAHGARAAGSALVAGSSSGTVSWMEVGNQAAPSWVPFSINWLPGDDPRLAPVSETFGCPG